MLNYFWFSTRNTHCVLVIALLEKKQAPFSKAVGNVELMHECPNMQTILAWEQQEWNKTKKQEEEDKKWGLIMERRNSGT